MVVKRNFLKGFTVEGFDDLDNVFQQVSDIQQQPYCFSVNIAKFDIENNDFEFEFSFGKDVLPDTNLPAYSSL